MLDQLTSLVRSGRTGAPVERRRKLLTRLLLTERIAGPALFASAAIGMTLVHNLVGRPWGAVTGLVFLATACVVSAGVTGYFARYSRLYGYLSESRFRFFAALGLVFSAGTMLVMGGAVIASSPYTLPLHERVIPGGFTAALFCLGLPALASWGLAFYYDIRSQLQRRDQEALPPSGSVEF